MSKTLVAVYGSLRKGLGNHRLLEHCEQLSVERLEGWDMHSLHAFPAIVKGDSSITIELYEVCEDTFARLDMLEGYPSFYDRTQVDTSLGKSWIYYHHEKPNNQKVMSGDWSEFLAGE